MHFTKNCATILLRRNSIQKLQGMCFLLWQKRILRFAFPVVFKELRRSKELCVFRAQLLLRTFYFPRHFLAINLQFLNFYDSITLQHKLNPYSRIGVYFVLAKIHARFRTPIWDVKVCVAAIVAVYFSCAASAAHFLFAEKGEHAKWNYTRRF